MNEPFYEGLELMLVDFWNLLLAHPDLYEQAAPPVCRSKCDH